MCLLIFYSSLLLIIAAVFSIADNATSTFQSIRDGETVVSTGGTFELGFWSPDASNRRYVGIWYKQISVTTIVWVANRDKPLADLSGILKVTNPGILVLNHDMSTVWSSNTSRTAQNPVARLLDSGAKLGRNTVTGFNWHLRSWKSPQDPSQGNCTSQLCPKGYAELFVMEDGLLRRYTWIDRTQGWVLYQTVQIDNYDNYAFCGVHGACNIQKSPVCSCLKGFTPKFPKEWDLVDWSNGCVRKTSLNCTGDVFQKYSGLKLPSTEQSWFNRSMNLKECEIVCMKNCSCTAYTNLDIRDGGTGCLLWYGDLIDIYIRMAAAEQDHEDDTKINAKYSESNAKKMRIIISTTMLSTGLLILGLALLFYVWKKQHQKGGKLGHDQKEDLELPLFDLMTIVSATSNFSIENKLGEGGFGSVFKGTMENGQEIAVKRLSKSSRQGLDEFKNEVTHIAKLQHRNLVKLLGCCIQEDEMILIYEFMPNKNQRRRMLLDWPKRFEIINGIARGLLYLHQDSRLRVIHRDLKASNILLGSEFDPKISDFSLARSFGGNEMKAKTKKVVGAYDYMSPEYTIDGLYSIKSDVYSFGVMVLEIAWMLHTEDMPLKLIDASVEDSVTLHEVVRMIHVAAVLMLGGEGALPPPLKPDFYSERDLTELEVSHSSKACSANEVTISLVEAR
ncbi:unnamed protein product [Malus baccata var. baccata]